MDQIDINKIAASDTNKNADIKKIFNRESISIGSNHVKRLQHDGVLLNIIRKLDETLCGAQDEERISRLYQKTNIKINFIFKRHSSTYASSSLLKLFRILR